MSESFDPRPGELMSDTEFTVHILFPVASLSKNDDVSLISD